MIDTGASTTYRSDVQDGYGGARFPGVSGWLDNDISSLSSGGFDEAGRTVDLVAPGDLNWALCSTNIAMYSRCTSYAGNPSPVIQSGGTSESSPLTAGAAALVIQAFRNTHAGQSPTPALVKQILTRTASDIGAPADQQGAGLVNAYQARCWRPESLPWRYGQCHPSRQRPPLRRAVPSTTTSVSAPDDGFRERGAADRRDAADRQRPAERHRQAEARSSI